MSDILNVVWILFLLQSLLTLIIGDVVRKAIDQAYPCLTIPARCVLARASDR